MPITKGIHVKNVDVGCGHDLVLQEGMQHMPGIKIEKRGNDVDSVGGYQSNGDETVD